MSVPHNGTRSLMNHLGIFAREQGLPDAGSWWHFGSHEQLLHKWTPFVHVPIRHPMDVAESWGSRHKSGNPLASMIKRYRILLYFVESGYPHQLHRVEDIPRTHGMGERQPEDRSAEVEEYQAALRDKIVTPNLTFFRQFYEDPEHGTGQLQ